MTHYTIAPAEIAPDGEQAHERLIECMTKNNTTLSDTLREHFATKLDEWLQRINGDYADKRHVNWLGRQRITRLPLGSFDAYLAAQSKL